MARYILITPVHGCPPSCPSGRQFNAGTTIASDVGSALAGDTVWPGLVGAPSRSNVLPLDAAASAAMGGIPIVTLAQLVTGNLCIGGAGLGGIG
jgi:hypothetical protein